VAKASKVKRGQAASASASSRTRGVESSRKVLSMLSWFEPGRPLATVETLARAAGVPKSTAYRYISILRETGFLTDDGRGAYHVAPRVFRLAGAAQAATNYVELARPGMERLAAHTGETVILVRRIGDCGVCIARVESEHSVRLSFEVGAAFALHAGASPKILLAHLSERDRHAYFSRAMQTNSQLKKRLPALERELGEIRASRLAFSNAEITPDIWAVAAPVMHGARVIAALSVCGPRFRLRGPARKKAEKLTHDVATKISEELDRLLPPAS
jgi:DNA-binding IclR family transcriptional regulator